MDYRSYVEQRARAGDLGAQRVWGAFDAPARNRHEPIAAAPSQPVTLEQVRERLDVIRAAEEVRYERARAERAGLPRIERPPTLEQELASARNEIQAHVSEATQFTAAERALLARLTKEQQSWNPFGRNAAKKETEKLHGTQHARYGAELTRAMRDFETNDAKQIEQRISNDEHIYRERVAASLGLEAEMRKARAVSRDDIPKIEKQVTVLERTGVGHLECEGPAWSASLDKLADAVDRPYQALPPEVRRDVQFAVRSEQRALARARSSISMDG
jgi:hypothetical protein